MSLKHVVASLKRKLQAVVVATIKTVILVQKRIARQAMQQRWPVVVLLQQMVISLLAQQPTATLERQLVRIVSEIVTQATP